MDFGASSDYKMVSIEATIIRANGKVEPQGVISYWHRNPLKRFWFWLKQSVKA